MEAVGDGMAEVLDGERATMVEPGEKGDAVDNETVEETAVGTLFKKAGSGFGVPDMVANDSRITFWLV